jgi:hypothetical protein
LSSRRRRYHDDVRVETQALTREVREVLAVSVRRKIIDRDGLLVFVAQFTQALEEMHESVRLRRARIERQKAQPWRPSRAAPPRREMRERKTGAQAKGRADAQEPALLAY